jgi:type I restriction enzyme, S subunit
MINKKKWDFEKLSSPKVAKLIMGQSPPSNSYNKNGEGLPFYQGKKEFGLLYPTPEIFCSKPNKIAEKGDILLSVRAPVGPTNLCNEKSCIGRGLASIRVNEKNISCFFLLYFFKFFETELTSKGQGSTFQAISKKVLEDLLIPLPPLPEQNRIVSKLDALFERIDKAIELVKENINFSQNLLECVIKSVFYDIQGKCEIKSIGQLCNKTTQTNPLNDAEKEFTYIDISCINRENHTIENPQVLLGKNAPSRAKKQIQTGDILFATTRPNLKNIACVGEEFDGQVASTGFCVIRTKTGVNRDFVFHYLTSDILQNQIKPFIRGAQYPAISDKDLLSCLIPVPPKEMQDKIARYISVIKLKQQMLMDKLIERLSYLQQLKNSILDSAFKGEL